MKWLPSIGRLTHRTNWGLFRGGLGDSDPKSSCSMGKLTQRTTFRLTGDVTLGLGGSEPESASLVCFVVSVNKPLVLLLIWLLVCVFIFFLWFCDTTVIASLTDVMLFYTKKELKNWYSILEIGLDDKSFRKRTTSKKANFQFPLLAKSFPKM